MAFTVFIVLYVTGAFCIISSFIFSVIAARHRKPGVPFIRLILSRTMFKNQSLYTDDGLKARRRAIALLCAAWIIIPFGFAAIAVAMLRGEMPVSKKRSISK